LELDLSVRRRGRWSSSARRMTGEGGCGVGGVAPEEMEGETGSRTEGCVELKDEKEERLVFLWQPLLASLCFRFLSHAGKPLLCCSNNLLQLLFFYHEQTWFTKSCGNPKRLSRPWNFLLGVVVSSRLLASESFPVVLESVRRSALCFQWALSSCLCLQWALSSCLCACNSTVVRHSSVTLLLSEPEYVAVVLSDIFL
jgi:hypothetical protein